MATRRPVVINVGAAGKGYLVAGGLEHPAKPRQVIGVANLHTRALCASASNRRRGARDCTHILDARTSWPVHDVVATWVISDDAISLTASPPHCSSPTAAGRGELATGLHLLGEVRGTRADR